MSLFNVNENADDAHDNTMYNVGQMFKKSNNASVNSVIMATNSDIL